MLNIESCRLQEHGRGGGCRVSRHVLSRASPGHLLRARINHVSRVRQHVGWKCSMYVRASMTLRLQRMTMTRYETIVYLYISYFYERISIIIKKQEMECIVCFYCWENRQRANTFERETMRISWTAKAMYSESNALKRWIKTKRVIVYGLRGLCTRMMMMMVLMMMMMIMRCLVNVSIAFLFLRRRLDFCRVARSFIQQL